MRLTLTTPLRHWAAELEGPKPSLAMACWKTVRHLYITALPLKILDDLTPFIGPVFLNLLLKVR